MYRGLRIIVLTLLVSLTPGVMGQKSLHSPFARNGIGNLESQGAFRTQAMGGISSGIRDNLTLNYLTPASYSSFDTTSFIFDIAMDYSLNRVSLKELKHQSGDVAFSHLMMGFPITKRWGVTTAILPVSNATYVINANRSDTDIIGSVTEQHTGTGGYQRALLGTGMAPLPFMSVGLNLFYLFGEITRVNNFLFTEDNNYFNTRKHGIVSLNGVGYEASVQFMFTKPGNRFINAGVTLSPGYNVKAAMEDMALRYSNIRNSPLSVDTLSYSSLSSDGHMPASVRAGFSLGQSNKFTAGADIFYAKWSKARLPGSWGTYRDALSLHAGAEYIPDKYSNYSLPARMEYRMGGYYRESYTLFLGEMIKEYGITFGAGIPMRKSRSRISLLFDLSTRGGIHSDIPRETRFSAGISLDLYDYWFLKARYE